MKIEKGDIWAIPLICPDTCIVIPTNVGWKTDGSNVMGAGIAKTAANLDPTFPKAYGRWCKSFGDRIYIHFAPLSERGVHLCAAPSKPLDAGQPHLSWRGKATMLQVEKSLGQIRDEAIIRSHLNWYMTLLGDGNGGLDTDKVLALTTSFAWPDNVTLVLR